MASPCAAIERIVLGPIANNVYAISDEANVKIWLEPEIAVASVKGRINQSMLNELLQEVRRNEQLCRDAWDQYIGE